MLGLDSVRGMRCIVDHVKKDPEGRGDAEMVSALSEELRAVEDTVRGRCVDLAKVLQVSIGQGVPLTDIGDRVATPLQRARETSAYNVAS